MSNAPISIRPMDVEDIDAVMKNEVRAYEFPWTRGVFLDCLRGNYECWVLVEHAVVVGHGVLSCAAGEAHLLNVCVGVEHQGAGFGRILVEHMLNRGSQRDAEVVFLEVRVTNTVAGALYESMGFNEIGRRRNYYPAANGHEDARVLALQLRMPT